MDDQTPFKMPPFTGRNILIFSDGTGQAGGLLPDEARSNVYKLYRANRCCGIRRRSLVGPQAVRRALRAHL